MVNAKFLVDVHRRARSRQTQLIGGVSLLLCACMPQAESLNASTAALDFEPSRQRSDMCSAANVVGVGLRGEYFAEPGLKGAALLSRVDPSVDFVSSLDWPADLAAKTPRSARWTGWVKAPTNGKYRFHVQPEQAYVMVSRVDVRAGASVQGEGIELVAGRFYPISIEVAQLGDQSLPVRLEWTTPHGARYVIPRALLNLPTETVATPSN